jgi:arginyl-tRNA--protein-N-Asp/Glu arginylyltransferase
MYKELQSLSEIKPGELDDFLAKGWFRMQQTIFTTDKEVFGNALYDTIWLRLRLDDFTEEERFTRLLKKNNGFQIEIKKAAITPDHEALFFFYKKSKLFQRSPSLQWLLQGDTSSNVYNTHMINMYDGSRMIGTGFFDLGNNSAAGICSVYHPDYATYSPGRYMIYEKIFYCKKNKFRYFYPGYFVPGYPLFDYKLTIGKTALEYFDTHNKTWNPVSGLDLSHYPPAPIG